jgi:hypothetical protein
MVYPSEYIPGENRLRMKYYGADALTTSNRRVF